jgi:hypothetical protein
MLRPTIREVSAEFLDQMMRQTANQLVEKANWQRTIWLLLRKVKSQKMTLPPRRKVPSPKTISPLVMMRILLKMTSLLLKKVRNLEMMIQTTMWLMKSVTLKLVKLTKRITK